MWSMSWDRSGAELAIAKAASYSVDFVEIALLNAPGVDGHHTRKLLEQNNMRSVCSLGLPNEFRASVYPERAIDYLSVAIDKSAEIGAEALTGVIYGSIGVSVLGCRRLSQNTIISLRRCLPWESTRKNVEFQ